MILPIGFQLLLDDPNFVLDKKLKHNKTSVCYNENEITVLSLAITECGLLRTYLLEKYRKS